jgi:hypothetical protein
VTGIRAAVFADRDYFKAKLGRIQQGDSEKSGAKFRSESEFIPNEKQNPRAMSRTASDCTSLATSRLKLSY